MGQAGEPTLTLPVVLVPHPHVRVDRNVLAGSPHVAGSRVPVRRLWAFFKSGASVERILRRYPQLGPAKVFDALAFAFDNPEVMEADQQREDDLLSKAQVRPKRASGSPEQIELPFGLSAPGVPPLKRR